MESLSVLVFLPLSLSSTIELLPLNRLCRLKTNAHVRYSCYAVMCIILNVSVGVFPISKLNLMIALTSALFDDVQQQERDHDYTNMNLENMCWIEEKGYVLFKHWIPMFIWIFWFLADSRISYSYMYNVIIPVLKMYISVQMVLATSQNWNQENELPTTAAKSELQTVPDTRNTQRNNYTCKVNNIR